MNRKYILLALLLFTGNILFSQDLKKLDQYFETAREEWDIPGYSIAIVHNGNIVLQKGYGILEEGKKEKADEHTLYAIASNSKAFTTAALAKIVQEGKLNWNDKVNNHLPYFELYDEYVSAETTVEDLLSHRVGLGTFSGDVIWYKSEMSPEEIIKKIQFVPQAFSFRNGYGYSNLMFITAGELIHKITGMPVGEYFQENFFKPLEMERTTTSFQKIHATDNVATPHKPVNFRNTPIEWTNWENVEATGGIISNVNDMANWMIFNLQNGVWKKDTFLTSSSRNRLWSVHNPYTVNHADNNFSTHFSGYGLGWGLSDYKGNMVVSHGGGYDGMYSRVVLVPDENWGIVILTNSMKPIMNILAQEAIDQLLDIPSEKDRSSKSLARWKENVNEEKRIKNIKDARVPDTKPRLLLDKYAGTYHADMYGEITVKKEGNELHLNFSHAPELSATLKHWHYDTWEIEWEKTHAWFDFGVVQFQLDDKMEVTGMKINVPNDDIFFNELDIKKMKN